MRTLVFLVVFCLVLTVPAFALFCSKCGYKLPAAAQFCAQCGTKVPASALETGKADKIKAAEHAKTVETAKRLPEPIQALDGTFRTKTDLYIYERRGDEHNILKKNLFFKPKRYKLPRNTKFKILEYVGDTLFVQSIPDTNGKIDKGWATEEELLLRSDWVKK